ncbi:uncharacterized [Tachysurus ichikawai]
MEAVRSSWLRSRNMLFIRLGCGGKRSAGGVCSPSPPARYLSFISALQLPPSLRRDVRPCHRNTAFIYAATDDGTEPTPEPLGALRNKITFLLAVMDFKTK